MNKRLASINNTHLRNVYRINVSEANMRKRTINNVAARRRSQLKTRHQKVLNRQKQFFVFIKPAEDAFFNP
ncbi:hypothetical protein ACVBIV_11765 [Shewanella sp. 0m-9]